MTLIDYIAAYLAGGFALLGWIAYIQQHDVRSAFWCAVLWPLVLLAIPIVVAFDRSRWRFDIVTRRDDRSGWGFRRPASGNGWAFRCPGFELQVWRP